MAQSEDTIVLSYPYSAAEHVKALEKAPGGLALRAVLITSTVLMSVCSVIIGAIMWFQGNHAGAVSDSLALFGLSAAWWFAASGISALERRRYRRQTPDGTLQLFRFGPGGMATSADTALIPWGLVSAVRETPQAFLLADASSTSWMSLPKRAFSDAQLAEFRTTIEREFASRPKQLKLLPAK